MSIKNFDLVTTTVTTVFVLLIAMVVYALFDQTQSWTGNYTQKCKAQYGEASFYRGFGCDVTRKPLENR